MANMDPVDEPVIQPVIVHGQDAEAAQQQDQVMADDPPVLPQQFPRLRRTHKDDFISSLLSKLSLREKLSKNKEIEDLNKARDLKNFNHHIDESVVDCYISIRIVDTRSFFFISNSNHQAQPNISASRTAGSDFKKKNAVGCRQPADHP